MGKTPLTSESETTKRENSLFPLFPLNCESNKSFYPTKSHHKLIPNLITHTIIPEKTFFCRLSLRTLLFY